MSTMNIPGFTAELSFIKSGRNYVTMGLTSQFDGGIQPAFVICLPLGNCPWWNPNCKTCIDIPIYVTPFSPIPDPGPLRNPLETIAGVQSRLG